MILLVVAAFGFAMG
jgi:hypothetical protein